MVEAEATNRLNNFINKTFNLRAVNELSFWEAYLRPNCFSGLIEYVMSIFVIISGRS